METRLHISYNCVATRYSTFKKKKKACFSQDYSGFIWLDGVIHWHFFTLKITLFRQHNISHQKKKLQESRRFVVYWQVLQIHIDELWFVFQDNHYHHWGINTFKGLFTFPQILVYNVLESWVFSSEEQCWPPHLVNAPVPLNILAANPWMCIWTWKRDKAWNHAHKHKAEGRSGGEKNFHRILNNTAAASWILHLHGGEGCSAEDKAWQEQATATSPHLSFSTTFLHSSNICCFDPRMPLRGFCVLWTLPVVFLQVR